MHVILINIITVTIFVTLIIRGDKFVCSAIQIQALEENLCEFLEEFYRWVLITIKCILNIYRHGIVDCEMVILVAQLE